MPCDFCHDPKPVVMFPATDFVVEEPTPHLPGEFLSSSSWSACDTCAVLVQADNFEALVSRAMQTNPGIRDEDRSNPELRQLIASTYEQFRAARTGPPEPMTGRHPSGDS